MRDFTIFAMLQVKKIKTVNGSVKIKTVWVAISSGISVQYCLESINNDDERRSLGSG